MDLKKQMTKRAIVLVIVAVAMLIVGGGYQLLYSPKPIVAGSFEVVNKGLEEANIQVNYDSDYDNTENYHYTINYDSDDRRVCNLEYTGFYGSNTESSLEQTGVTKNVKSMEGLKTISRQIEVPINYNGLELQNVQVKLYGCRANKSGSYDIDTYLIIREITIDASQNDMLTKPHIQVGENTSRVTSGDVFKTTVIDKSNSGLQYFGWSVVGESDSVASTDTVNFYKMESSYTHQISVDKVDHPQIIRIFAKNNYGNYAEREVLIQARSHAGPYCYSDYYITHPNNKALKVGETADITVTCLSDVSSQIDSVYEGYNGVTAALILSNDNIEIEQVTLDGRTSGLYKLNSYTTRYRIKALKEGKTTVSVNEKSIKDTNGNLLNNNYGNYTATIADVNVSGAITRPEVKLSIIKKSNNYVLGNTYELGAEYGSKSFVVGDFYKDAINIYLDGKLDPNAATIETGFAGSTTPDSDGVSLTNYYISVYPLKKGKLEISVKDGTFIENDSKLANKESNKVTLNVVEPEKPACVISIVYNGNRNIGEPYNAKLKCYYPTGQNKNLGLPEIDNDDFIILRSQDNNPWHINKNGIGAKDFGNFLTDSSAATVKPTYNSKESNQNNVVYDLLITPNKSGYIGVALKKGVFGVGDGKTNEKSSAALNFVNNPNAKKPICTIGFKNDTLEFNEAAYINVECTAADENGLQLYELDYVKEYLISHFLYFSNDQVLSNFSIEGLKSEKNRIVINIKAYGVKAGSTRVGLKENAIEPKFVMNYGNVDIKSTNTLTVKPKVVDKTAPGCSFTTKPVDFKINKTTKITLTCSDPSGLKDSTLIASDIAVNGLLKRVSVVSITPLRNMYSNTYSWNITLKGKILGSTTIYLKQGALKDNYNNINNKTTSSTIKVKLF